MTSYNGKAPAKVETRRRALQMLPGKKHPDNLKVLLFPSATCQEMRDGLKAGKYSRKTHFILIEKDPTSIQQIKFFCVDNELTNYIIINTLGRSIQEAWMVCDSEYPNGREVLLHRYGSTERMGIWEAFDIITKKDTEPFDMMYFDTCNQMSDDIYGCFQNMAEIYPYVFKNSPIGATFQANRGSSKKFQKDKKQPNFYESLEINLCTITDKITDIHLWKSGFNALWIIQEFLRAIGYSQEMIESGKIFNNGILYGHESEHSNPTKMITFFLNVITKQQEAAFKAWKTRRKNLAIA